MPFSGEYPQKGKRVDFHLPFLLVPVGLSSLNLVEDLLCKLSHDINNLSSSPPIYINLLSFNRPFR